MAHKERDEEKIKSDSGHASRNEPINQKRQGWYLVASGNEKRALTSGQGKTLVVATFLESK